MRSRIYWWYALLREIDQPLRDGANDELREFGKRLNEIELELGEVRVRLSFMEEFYHLRLRIDLVKRRLEERQDSGV